jgi:anion-transporting  ArsA/GET3 family ATPase
MQHGFVDRAHQVSALLRAEETTFCVVATPESVPVREAKRLLDALSGRSLHLGLLIANRVLPPGFLDPAAIAAADELVASGGTAPLPEECAPPAVADGTGPDAATLARVLLGAARSFGEFAQAAAREHELLAELADRTVPPVTVGDAMDEVVDLAGLAAIGRHLLAAPAPGRRGPRSPA